MEKYSEALKYYEKAFDIRDAMSPKKNLDLAVTSHNLGLMHYYTKNNGMAVKYVTLAIEIVKEISNSEHPYLQVYTKTLEMIEKDGIWM